MDDDRDPARPIKALSLPYLYSRMTDRQTDRSNNFAITVFNNNEIQQLEDVATYPAYVKKVFGGREVCPETRREHFQGHIQCRTQQRFSAIKKWLPTAHIEVARNFTASIAYALKSDTAKGEKTTTVNNKPFVTDRMAMEKLVDVSGASFENPKHDYWERVRHILMDEPDLCGLYAKPDLYRLWSNTKSVWIERKKLGYSITPNFVRETNEIIIPPDNINGPEICS